MIGFRKPQNAVNFNWKNGPGFSYLESFSISLTFSGFTWPETGTSGRDYKVPGNYWEGSHEIDIFLRSHCRLKKSLQVDAGQISMNFSQEEGTRCTSSNFNIPFRERIKNAGRSRCPFDFSQKRNLPNTAGAFPWN
jgi:hypothetical protein